MLDDLVGCSGSGLDVDVGVGQLVLVEKALRGAAIGTPGGGIDGDLHEVCLEFRWFRARCQTSLVKRPLQTVSSWWTVRSFSTLPVFSVVAGSNKITQHSFSATGRCSTPR